LQLQEKTAQTISPLPTIARPDTFPVILAGEGADFPAHVADRCEMISSLVNRLCDGEPKKAEDSETDLTSQNP